MTTLRALIAYGEMEEAKTGKEKVAKPFNGWKVKIDFEAKTLKGKPYHSEYWFILDKEAEIVVKSFEIPLLWIEGQHHSVCEKQIGRAHV